MRNILRFLRSLRRQKKMFISGLALVSLWIYLSFDYSVALSTVNLAGSDWWLIGANFSLAAATLPGDVYYELFRRNITSDPYYRDNDVKLRWISRQSWTYAKIFHLDETMFKSNFFLLKLTGVDTICDVFLNEQLLANTSNMFRTYRLPVDKRYLRAGGNQLEFRFKSPQIWARQQNDQHFASRRYHVPPGSHYPPGDWNGEPHGNYIRKMQASFSWDWGPSFPTVGVNGQMSLSATDSCVVLGQTVLTQRPDDNSTNWTVKISVQFWCGIAVDNLEGKFQIVDVTAEKKMNFKLQAGESVQTVELEAANVQLWWPNNFGDQKLYQLNSQFKVDNIWSTLTNKFGFRSGELIEEPPKGNKQFGLTFYFKVNGVPIFLKGANWIPADSFMTRLTCDRLEFILRSVRLANMNVLRVWGGGVYEPDCFYALADRYGILIWQDLMFACAMYPGDPEFVANVKEEFRDQMRRISSHPSLLLYCGNNENEMGFAFGWFSSEATRDQLVADYLQVFKKTAGEVLAEVDPSRPYILSSPTNGKKTLEEGGMSSDPNGIMFGDKHFWTPVKDSWFPDEIPLSRCPSEFGIQSLPSLDALRQVMTPSDLGWDTPMMRHRQHQEVSVGQMLGYINDHLVKPKSCDNSSGSPRACATMRSGDLGVMIYLTQLNQAVLMKTEIEHYRRGRSILKSNGEGLTMCSLYWQLNDIWQAPTWSSIDFADRWKFLQYFAKRFNAQVLISPYVSGGILRIYVVNDGVEGILGTKAIVEVLQLGKGFVPVAKVDLKVAKISPLGSQLIFEKKLVELIGNPAIYDHQVVINTRLISESGVPIGPNNVVFPVHPNKIATDIYGSVAITKVEPSKDPKSAQVYRFEDFQVTIEASSVAPFVWLEAAGIGGIFSDNGYTQTAKEEIISFHCEEPQQLETFRQRLTVTTFRDLYNP